MLLPFRVSDRNRLCIFNFSSIFLLSHLTLCLSVHSPPTFTHQYKPCSSPLYNFLYSCGTQILNIQHTQFSVTERVYS
jgi:hypothetical protein